MQTRSPGRSIWHPQPSAVPPCLGNSVEAGFPKKHPCLLWQPLVLSQRVPLLLLLAWMLSDLHQALLLALFVALSDALFVALFVAPLLALLVGRTWAAALPGAACMPPATKLGTQVLPAGPTPTSGYTVRVCQRHGGGAPKEQGWKGGR